LGGALKISIVRVRTAEGMQSSPPKKQKTCSTTADYGVYNLSKYTSPGENTVWGVILQRLLAMSELTGKELECVGSVNKNANRTLQCFKPRLYSQAQVRRLQMDNFIKKLNENSYAFDLPTTYKNSSSDHKNIAINTGSRIRNCQLQINTPINVFKSKVKITTYQSIHLTCLVLQDGTTDRFDTYGVKFDQNTGELLQYYGFCGPLDSPVPAFFYGSNPKDVVYFQMQFMHEPLNVVDDMNNKASYNENQLNDFPMFTISMFLEYLTTALDTFIIPGQDDAKIQNWKNKAIKSIQNVMDDIKILESVGTVRNLKHVPITLNNTPSVGGAPTRLPYEKRPKPALLALAQSRRLPGVTARTSKADLIRFLRGGSGSGSAAATSKPTSRPPSRRPPSKN
jgi:hypothetical protein